MRMYTESDENLFVVVELRKCIIELIEGFHAVDFVLRKVKKVKHSTNCMYELDSGLTIRKTKTNNEAY